VKLLPVRVAEQEQPATCDEPAAAPASTGAIHIELPGRALISLEGAWMRGSYAQCWSALFSDRSSNRNAHLDRSRSHGHAPRLSGTQRAGDLIKVLWFDGDGLCLLAKRLERGRFIWPQARSGSVSLSRTQLSMLLEGIDWRAPARTAEPLLSV
jgi:hypothetical protein